MVRLYRRVCVVVTWLPLLLTLVVMLVIVLAQQGIIL